MPYAGFTWTEGGVIFGVALVLAAIAIVSMLTDNCCAPANRAAMTRQIVAYLTTIGLCMLSTFPIFWAAARLRPRTVGWGRTLAGHAMLALVVAFTIEWGQNLIYAASAAAWPPPTPPDYATHPLAVLTRLQFLGKLIPYLFLLMIGLGRYEYLRSRARRARAQRLEREAERLRTQLTTARLEALRMQINPHFLFNTLHTIATMAGSNPDGIRQATARLSDMLRYALSTTDQQEVPLEEELDVLDSYLAIQKLRLNERLETRIEVAPGVRNALVPTLLLQPLAENAVQHGFEGSSNCEGSSAPGLLIVRATREGADLVLHVIDNGTGPPPAWDETSPSEEGIGLHNLAERLEGLYGPAATLNFTPSEAGGVAVEIRLPFHTRTADDDLHVTAVAAEHH